MCHNIICKHQAISMNVSYTKNTTFPQCFNRKIVEIQPTFISGSVRNRHPPACTGSHWMDIGSANILMYAQ